MENQETIMPHAQSHQMVYFSLVCPEAVRREIRDFQQWMYQRHGTRAAMKSPAHITLIPPFWWPAKDIEALSDHAAVFRLMPRTVSVRLDGFGHFGKRVLFVRLEAGPELQGLQEAFSRHIRVMAGTSMKPDDQPFHPHVTIATRDMTPAAFREAWEHFSQVEFRADMTLDTISMMLHSPGAWEIHRSFRWGS